MPFLRQSGIITSRRRSSIVTPPSGAPQLVGAYSGSKFTTLIYDQDLSRGSLATGGFSMTLNGSAVTITNVFANDSSVTITHWGTSVVNNQTVKVSYTGSSITNGTTPAATFSNVTATTGPATLNGFSSGIQVNDDPVYPTVCYRGSTVPAGTKPPLIIVAFHTHPPATEVSTSWIEACDKYGLACAILEGSDGYSVAGGTPYIMSSHASAMPGRLPAWISAVNADPNQIYMTGQSAGAIFSFFLIHVFDETTWPVKGIAPVDGAVYVNGMPHPPARTTPVGLLLTDGGADSAVPVAGSGTYYSYDASRQVVATINGTQNSTEISNSVGVLTQKFLDGNVRGQIVTSGSHIWPGDPAATGNDATFKITDQIAQWVLASALGGKNTGSGGGGVPTVMARFGMESGTGPGNGSPFTGLQARNGANTQDINRNFGRGYQIIAGAGDEADTGTAYGRLSLEAVRTVGGVHWYGPQEQYTGTTTSGSATVTISTTYLAAGMGVSGTGIPAGTVINSVGSGSIVLSAAATSTGSRTLTFDRQITSSQLDRAQYIADGSTVVPARPDHSEGWYTFAYRINSWPTNVCVPGNTASQGIILMEPAYQGLGAGSVGPMFIKLRDIGGVPKMDINLATGLAVGTSPAYQYNSETGYGFPGGTRPNQDILPAGQVTLGVWHEFIWRVFWSTSATDGELQFWHREKGQSSWTQTYHMNPGIAATLQYTTSPSNYQDNGYEVLTAYRHMVLTTGSESPAWDLEFDTFDNSATSFADAAARFAP